MSKDDYIKGRICQRTVISKDKIHRPPKELSKIIDKDECVEKVTKKFLKRLDGYIVKHFKKIRVTEKRDDVLEDMYKKKTQLANKNDEGSKKKLEEVELEMAKLYSEDMYSKIQEELKGMNSEDGGLESWIPLEAKK